MRRLIFFIFLISSVLHSNDIGLNLPNVFSTKLSKKLTDKDWYCWACCYLPFTPTPLIFNFENGKVNATINTKVNRYYHYFAINGEFSNGKFKGELVRKVGNYQEKNNILYSLMTEKVKLEGKLNRSTGILDIFAVGIKTLESKTKYNEKGKISPYGIWKIEQSLSIDLTNVIHFYLQLPINQTQSSQKFIPNTSSESQPIQPITIPKTNLSVNISANKETKEEVQEGYDQCKDLNQDQATKEYCANKAYNKKIDEENKRLDIEEEKQIEKDEKAKKEYQKKLDKYNEEERQINLKVIKENEIRRKQIAQDDIKRDKLFNNSIANDMQERKNKQAEKTKAQRKIYEAEMIIHQFVDDADDRKQYLDKIGSLSNKDTTLEDAIKIKNNARKKHYDSIQLVHKKELDLQLSKVKYWDTMSKRASFVRDTSITINKILALPVVAQASLGTIVSSTAVKAVTVTTTIPFVHGATTNAVDAYVKDGGTGVVVSLAKDALDQVTLKTGGSFIDKAYRTVKYNTTGVEIPSDIKAYDKNGHIVTKTKIGVSVYDKNKNDITFAVMKKSTQHNLWTTKANKDIKSGDINKEVSTMTDIWGIADAAVDMGLKLLK